MNKKFALVAIIILALAAVAAAAMKPDGWKWSSWSPSITASPVGWVLR